MADDDLLDDGPRLRNAQHKDETLDDASFDSSPDVLTATAQGRLRTIIERVERLEEDRAAVMEDIKEVFAEAKGDGYCVKTVRKVIRIRKQDRAKRQEEEAVLDLYLTATGDL